MKLLTRREGLAAAAAIVLAPSPAWGSVTKELENIHGMSADNGERITRVSKLFLGKRYQLSALGEGEGGDRDNDPEVRFDRFDCVTLVETVMAFAWERDFDAAYLLLQAIRYTDGKIDYAARKHIMMAQWIPQNIAAGFVTDVTKATAGRLCKTARLVLTDDDFTSDEGSKLLLAEGERPLGDHAVPFVPIGSMYKVSDRIPHGSVITTIRTRRPLVPYRETHVGLLIVRGGNPVVRHAHQKSGRVIETPLVRFVKMARAAKKWPVVGFNLLRISDTR